MYKALFALVLLLVCVSAFDFFDFFNDGFDENDGESHQQQHQFNAPPRKTSASGTLLATNQETNATGTFAQIPATALINQFNVLALIKRSSVKLVSLVQEIDGTFASETVRLVKSMA